MPIVDRRVPAALALVAALLTPSAAGGRDDAPATDDEGVFVERIAGTTLTLTTVRVPGGRVAVDGPAGPREVEVADLAFGRTEITWDLFDAFIFKLDQPAGAGTADGVTRPSKPYISMDRGFGHAGYPAISMSHKAAEAFCVWLSRKTGRRYRLPTEAEWRHACSRSGVTPENLDELAWHRGNSQFKTHPVGTTRADGGGLHDLWGNAAEWCTGLDGKPVTYGGSYRDDAGKLGCGARVAPTRAWNASDPQFPKSVWWLADAGFVGFRVVREFEKGDPDDSE